MKRLLLIFVLFFPAITLANDSENKTVLTDSFDRVEFNHFYDDQGRHVFDQVIWYDWVDGWGHRIGAWRLVKNTNTIPTFNRQSGKYESLWYDNDILRKVSAKYMIESWEQYDIELVGRETWPKEKRRDLQQLNNVKKVEPTTLTLPFGLRLNF